MEKIAYYRFTNIDALSEFALDHAKQGYVISGSINTIMIPRWTWLGFGLGTQQAFEVTMVKREA